MCPAGAVVASWSLTPEVAGLNPFPVVALNSANSVKKFRENSNIVTEEPPIGDNHWALSTQVNITLLGLLRCFEIFSRVLLKSYLILQITIPRFNRLTLHAVIFRVVFRSALTCISVVGILLFHIGTVTTVCTRT